MWPWTHFLSVFLYLHVSYPLTFLPPNFSPSCTHTTFFPVANLVPSWPQPSHFPVPILVRSRPKLFPFFSLTISSSVVICGPSWPQTSHIPFPIHVLFSLHRFTFLSSILYSTFLSPFILLSCPQISHLPVPILLPSCPNFCSFLCPTLSSSIAIHIQYLPVPNLFSFLSPFLSTLHTVFLFYFSQSIFIFYTNSNPIPIIPVCLFTRFCCPRPNFLLPHPSPKSPSLLTLFLLRSILFTSYSLSCPQPSPRSSGLITALWSIQFQGDLELA